jgi:asparagine synthase (glutamine-hydrolysing)
MRHDRMGMAASIEMRVPFLENRVIDMGLHAPLRWRIHRRRTKWIVKEVARRQLPRSIVDQRKRGFPMPQSFRRGPEQLLRGGALAEICGWSEPTVEGLIGLGERTAAFALGVTEVWARVFFRREDPDQLGERLVAL